MAKMALIRFKLQWHDINWQHVNKFVSNIQYKMVVAYRKGNLNEVYNLQYRVIMSYEGRALAVRKVSSNKGNKTPGVDKILWNSPSKKLKAISELRSVLLMAKSYNPDHVKRVWIPKTNSKDLRPLGIPTVLDRALQTLVTLSLDPIIEETSDLYSYGSRKFRSPHDALNRLRHLLDKPNSSKWIFDIDLSKCFDNISHEFIEKEIDSILCGTGKTLVKKWLKAGIVDKGVLSLPTKGVPQGGVISPLLCNMTLNGVDKIVRPNTPRIGTKAYNNLKGCWSVRYVDDIIIISPTREKIVNEYYLKLKEFLKERGLEISNHKSRIINFEKESLTYLGWNLCLQNRNLKYNKVGVNKSVLITKPTKESVKRIKLVIKTAFSHKTNMPMGAIIRKLNPVIRGWTNYYRLSFHSQKVFAHLSAYVYRSWFSWSRRMHPIRNRSWLVNRYIFQTSKHSWQIGLKNKQLILDPKTVLPQKLAAIKTGVNPYFNKEYYEKRFRILDLTGSRKAIYEKHNYRCAACGELLDKSEVIEIHHIIPRSKGGGNELSNLVALHKTCHESVTFAKNIWYGKNLKK
jgi:RNA-directed DNA polymerase